MCSPCELCIEAQTARTAWTCDNHQWFGFNNSKRELRAGPYTVTFFKRYRVRSNEIHLSADENFNGYTKVVQPTSRQALMLMQFLCLFIKKHGGSIEHANF